MLLSEQIAAHIPYLRRYARALTGSQESGDAYVLTLLEAIVEDSSILPRDRDTRVALYQVFSRLWSSVALNSAPLSGEPDYGKQDFSQFTRIARLTPLSRQAVLLLYVEGFTRSEVCRIMNLDEIRLEALLEEATQEFAQDEPAQVLIIEDEELIAADLSYIVKDLGHAVIGVARTRDEALALSARRRPGMILADIQLADGSSGMDAVTAITAQVDAPSIFITAYPEKYLSGDKPEPTFLITKPYKIETVMATINQALFLARKRADRSPALH